MLVIPSLLGANKGGMKTCQEEKLAYKYMDDVEAEKQESKQSLSPFCCFLRSLSFFPAPAGSFALPLPTPKLYSNETPRSKETNKQHERKRVSIVSPVWSRSFSRPSPFPCSIGGPPCHSLFTTHNHFFFFFCMCQLYLHCKDAMDRNEEILPQPSTS